MCVALHDASFGQTTVAGWRFRRRRTHCLMYGNEPANRVTVANAMLLHIPIAHGTTLTRDNFIPTSGLSLVLDDMWLAAPKFEERVTRGGLFGVAKGGSVTVFDMGKYTWVAATRADPQQVSAALETVRQDRRPQAGEQLIDFYLRTWPDDALAIACFSQAGGEATEPAAIEYVPQDWDILRMPAVDAHGEIPGFDRPVTVNHRLIIGTDEFGVGGRVTYRERGRMDPRLREVLPERVVGAELLQVPMANGDFYVDFGRFTQGSDGSETRNGHVLRAHGSELTDGANRIPVQLG
jgi:hypothetical protein